MVKRLSGNRERQAEATKDSVAAAARELFTERGFAGTTVTAISVAAGVPEQTIYSAFGNKSRILARVTEVWMRETKTRESAAAYFEADTADRRLRLFAALNRHQLDAGADILYIYREAARTDPSIAAALSAMVSARETEIAKLLLSLETDLRDGLSLHDALAITLALCVDGAYAAMRDAGWDGERYEHWLGDALVDQLLRVRRSAVSS